MAKRAISVACLICFIFSAFTYVEGATIGHLFEGKSPVKVYVAPVVNGSGQGQISADIFRKTLEDSLNNRKSMDFDTVNAPAGSDIQVSAVINGYSYMKRGPFKPTPGVGTLVADAVATATSNYVEMEVTYTVTDTKSDKVLWKRGLKEYIKKVMTPEESVPLIYDKSARVFVSKCFGRGARGRSIVPRPR